VSLHPPWFLIARLEDGISEMIEWGHRPGDTWSVRK
jgi:hypothetical protein